MYQLTNWVETFDALTQFDPAVQSEITHYLTDTVIPGDATGQTDPVTDRSTRFEVRSGLLLFCDVDPVTRSLDLLSIEALVAPAAPA